MAQHNTGWSITGILEARKPEVKLKMGGKTDLERVVAYVSPELKQELEEWAQADERSVSWLVAKLIDKSLQERRKQRSASEVVNMR